MADPETTTTLAHIVGLALAALLGTGGKVGWDKWRNGRNGGVSRDARFLERAITTSGEKVSGEIRALAETAGDLHTKVSILLDRTPRG